jgi:hypothetical protein
MSENRQALRPVDVRNWLQQNQRVDDRWTTLEDAYRALNWPSWEARLKTKRGNLFSTEGRLRLQIARQLGDNGAGRRRELLQIRPPQDAEEWRGRRRVDRERQALNRQHGKGSFQTDHIFSLDEMGRYTDRVGRRLLLSTIGRLEEMVGHPIGDRPGNVENITRHENGKKNADDMKRLGKRPTPAPRTIKTKPSNTPVIKRSAKISTGIGNSLTSEFESVLDRSAETSTLFNVIKESARSRGTQVTVPTGEMFIVP